MWHPIAVPAFCERLLGFSVPRDRTVLVISYEGVHMLRLGESIGVSTDHRFVEYDVYDPETGIAEYDGARWDIIGLHKGRPIHSSPQGDQLVLSESTSSLQVVGGSSSSFTTTFENFSGDWAAATFSPDGEFVVLGCPYDFDFRVWRRE
jgi:hypothetical protein